MPIAPLNTGIKMGYDTRGEGEDLILIPGTGGTDHTWIYQIDAFQAAYRCTTFDLRGAGRSDRPGGDYTVALLADDVRALMDHMGIAKAHLAGWSLGGAIAMEFGLTYPERVKSLSLHSTWGGTDRWLRIRFEATRFLLLHAPNELYRAYRRWLVFSRGALESGLAEKLDASGTSPGGDKEAKARLYDADINHNATSRLSQIRAPTLVTHGEVDNALPVRYGDEVHRLISGSVYHLFSHSVLMERPEEFNTAQLDFLKRSRA